MKIPLIKTTKAIQRLNYFDLSIKKSLKLILDFSTTNPDAPVNTELPSISGGQTEGELLTVADGLWDGSPDSYTYQWQRESGSWEDISGETNNTYTLQALDVGTIVRCVVTATNVYGSTSAASDPTGTIGAGGGG